MAKVIMGILTLLVILSVIYGCAKVGLVPVQQLAASSPIAAKILRAIRLTSPPGSRLASSRKRIKPRPVAKKPTPPPAPVAVAPPPAVPPPVAVAAAAPAGGSQTAGQNADESAPTQPDATAHQSAGAKLTGIYNTMDPDDIAKILADLPDPVVIQTLCALDQKKAGKVLAAMDAARAAKITQKMLATPPPPKAMLPAATVP